MLFGFNGRSADDVAMRDFLSSLAIAPIPRRFTSTYCLLPGSARHVSTWWQWGNRVWAHRTVVG